MKELNDIEKALKDKLQNFEAPVRDGLWTNIQSSVSTSGSIAAAASSKIGAILLKTVAAISVVGIGTYLVVKNIDSSKEKTPTTLAVETSKSKSIDEETSTEKINKVTLNQTKNNTQEKVSTYTPTINSVELTKNVHSNPVSSPSIDESNKTQDDFKIEETESKSASTISSSGESKKEINSSEENTTNKGAKKVPAETDNTIVPAEEAETTPKITSLELTLPNVITPNGDGNNDVLIIKTPPLRKFVMEVYNNRGELIFKSVDQNIGWSGQDMSGNPVPDGSYFYKIIAEGEDGATNETKTQTILVTR